MTKIRSEAQSEVPILSGRRIEQATRVFEASQCCRHRQINRRATSDQCFERLQLTVQSCCVRSKLGMRSVVTQEIDEGKLCSGFARHPSGRDQHQCVVPRRLAGASIENDIGDLNNVDWLTAVANRIFGYEFEQRWILKVVTALKDDTLICQMRIFVQV